MQSQTNPIPARARQAPGQTGAPAATPATVHAEALQTIRDRAGFLRDTRQSLQRLERDAAAEANETKTSELAESRRQQMVLQNARDMLASRLLQAEEQVRRTQREVEKLGQSLGKKVTTLEALADETQQPIPKHKAERLRQQYPTLKMPAAAPATPSPAPMKATQPVATPTQDPAQLARNQVLDREIAGLDQQLQAQHAVVGQQRAALARAHRLRSTPQQANAGRNKNLAQLMKHNYATINADREAQLAGLRDELAQRGLTLPPGQLPQNQPALFEQLAGRFVEQTVGQDGIPVARFKPRRGRDFQEMAAHHFSTLTALLTLSRLEKTDLALSAAVSEIASRLIARLPKELPADANQLLVS